LRREKGAGERINEDAETVSEPKGERGEEAFE